MARGLGDLAAVLLPQLLRAGDADGDGYEASLCGGPDCNDAIDSCTTDCTTDADGDDGQATFTLSSPDAEGASVTATEQDDQELLTVQVGDGR